MAKAKKQKPTYPTGTQSIAARGLRALTLGLETDVHAAARLAATLRDPGKRPNLAAWVAKVVEAAARAELKAAGIPWPAKADGVQTL